MTTKALKFNIGRTSNAAISFKKLKKINSILLAFAIAGAIVYSYLLIGTVVKIANRAKNEKEISNISFEIKQLQSNYMLALNDKTGLDFAKSMGFKAPANTYYVSKTSLGSAGISYNGL